MGLESVDLIMKKFSFVNFVVIAMFIVGCGSNHPCIGHWQASSVRDSDPSITDYYSYEINGDGTCTYTWKGSGSKNFEIIYTGTWEEVSDDIIYVDVKSEPTTTHASYSDEAISKAVSKATNELDRRVINAQMSRGRETTAVYAHSEYIRSDGAHSGTIESLDRDNNKLQR